MKQKVTLTIAPHNEGGFKFAKNGDILCGIAKVGTWECRNVWKENGGSRLDRRSGCRLVHYLWKAYLIGDNKPFIAYSRKELYEILEGRSVTLEIDFKD